MRARESSFTGDSSATDCAGVQPPEAWYPIQIQGARATNHIEVEQSSETHPGHLTDKDLEALRPLNGPLIKSVYGRVDQTRRDADAIFIVIKWIVIVASTGGVAAFGKDAYEWIKSKVKPLMQQKIDQTQAQQSAYPVRDPIWKISFTMQDGD
jgi:hypothetical protein